MKYLEPFLYILLFGAILYCLYRLVRWALSSSKPGTYPREYTNQPNDDEWFHHTFRPDEKVPKSYNTRPTPPLGGSHSTPRRGKSGTATRNTYPEAQAKRDNNDPGFGFAYTASDTTDYTPPPIDEHSHHDHSPIDYGGGHSGGGGADSSWGDSSSHDSSGYDSGSDSSSDSSCDSSGD